MKTIPYGGEEYFAKALGVKTSPVSRKTLVSKRLRADLPDGWNLATKDVRRGEDGRVYATMYAKAHDHHGFLVKNLGAYMAWRGLRLVECVRLPAGFAGGDSQELAAIVSTGE